MAITVTERDAHNGSTAATSHALVPATNFTSNTYALLILGYENTGTAGADPISSVTDTDSNTWTLIHNVLYDPAGAGAGTVLRFYECSNCSLTTGDTITVAFSNSARLTSRLFQISADANKYIRIIPGQSYPSVAQATDGSWCIVTNTRSWVSGELAVAAFSIESDGSMIYSETDNFDSTGGNWTGGSEIGTLASGQILGSAYKILTGSVSSQLYGPACTNGYDYTGTMVGFEQVNTFTPVDPFGQFGFFGI